MKKLGWYAVSAVVAACILFGALLLAANLYVQSRAVQLRIRQALAATLRMPISLKKTTYTPWGGLRIDGVVAHAKQKVGKDGDPAMVNELLAESFRVRFAPLALLQRQFEASDVLLDHPRLSWAQDADNRWRLPSEKLTGMAKREREKSPPTDRAPAAAEPAGPPAPGEPVPTVPPLKEPSADDATPVAITSETEAPATLSAHHLTIEKFRLRHGTMDFFNHRRGLLGRFEEVDVDGKLQGIDRATGVARFERAVLPRAGVKLSLFQSIFAYDREAGLTLTNATARIAEGKVTAGCHVRTALSGTPYDVQCRLEDVNLDQLIKDAGGSRGLVQGRLQGTLDATGVSDDPESTVASGEVSLTDAQVREFPLFQTIGSMLRIDDLQHFRFKVARLNYRVEGETIQIQPLLLASNNLQVTAQGRYHVEDDRLEVHARLVIDQAISRQLPRVIEQQFTADTDGPPGTRYLDFDVKGPINKPSSNLYQRVLPNALDSLLDGLLRPSGKRNKEKTPRPNKPASPAPTAESF